MFRLAVEKRKNNPPLEAFSICKPRFQSTNAHAVEIIPKYNTPPQMLAAIAKYIEPNKVFFNFCTL